MAQPVRPTLGTRMAALASGWTWTTPGVELIQTMDTNTEVTSVVQSYTPLTRWT